MKIFVARAKIDYGSQYEKNSIDRIKDERELWNGGDAEIIEFPDINIINEELNKGKYFFLIERDIFYPLIRRCDIFIALPVFNENNIGGYEKRGSFGTGVRIEAKYALSIHKMAYLLDFDDTFKKLTRCT